MKNKEQTKTDTQTDREFREVPGGVHDDYGFYTTPNGSFWDPDGVYFNREGFDRHGGYYNDNYEYIPGEGWDEINHCYKSDNFDQLEEDYDEEGDLEDDYGYYKHGYDDDLLDEEDLLMNDPNIEKVTFVQNFREEEGHTYSDYNANYTKPQGTTTPVVDEEIKNSFKSVEKETEDKPKKKNKLDDLFNKSSKTEQVERKSSMDKANQNKLPLNQPKAVQNEGVDACNKDKNKAIESANINNSIPTNNNTKGVSFQSATLSNVDNEQITTNTKQGKIIVKKNVQENKEKEQPTTNEKDATAKSNYEIDPNDFDRSVNINNRESNLIFKNEENQFENLNRNNYNPNYKHNKFQNKNKYNQAQNNYYNQMGYHQNNYQDMRFNNHQTNNNMNFNYPVDYNYPQMNYMNNMNGNRFNPNINYEAEQQAYQQFLMYQSMMSQGYSPYQGNNGYYGQKNN